MNIRPFCRNYLRLDCALFVQIGCCLLCMAFIIFPICFYMHSHSCCGRVLLLLLLLIPEKKGRDSMREKNKCHKIHCNNVFSRNHGHCRVELHTYSFFCDDRVFTISNLILFLIYYMLPPMYLSCT